MYRGSQQLRWMAALVVILLAAILVGCQQPVEPTAEATAVGEAIPAGVLSAREAVLEFLREGANECVPPKQAAWRGEVSADPSAGFDVYRFYSGECAMTITTAQESSADAIYHVALGDGATGFCWQSVVDGRGQILLTGNAAQTDPTFGNPAKNYCEQTGHTYEVVSRAGDQLCGMCVFADGRMCNAWAYFHGACTPENAPTPEP